MPGLDIFDIKQQNFKRIIDAVRFQKPMTKREIADSTALSFATVSNLCNELVEKKILSSNKKEGISVGRTPNDLAFAAERFNAICINLEMEGVMNFAILNLHFAVVYQKKYDISNLHDPQEIVAYAKTIFERDVPAEIKENKKFIGVGVAVSSIFDLKTGTLINCAIGMFSGVKMKEIVERVFALPAYVDNEANLCALSVTKRGGKNSNIVYLYVSQGVGVGIICQGKLLRGVHGYAGEIAHMPLADSAYICPTCGNTGCVENELSVGGILRRAFGEETSKKKNWEDFVSLLKTGQREAAAVAEKSAVLLGKLSSVLVNLFDPSVLYLGGEVAQIYEFIRDGLCAVMERRCLPDSLRELEILADTKSDDTINVGICEEIYNNWSERVM